jgi:hypothetical protein
MVYEIVGVLPDGFIPPQQLAAEPWSGIALSWQIFDSTSTQRRFTPPFLRLRPGVSVAQVQLQLDTVVAAQRAATKTVSPVVSVRVRSVREALFGRYTTYASLSLVAALLVLGAACANLVSLFLVRARSRLQAAAVRLALGASPRHLVLTAVFEALLVVFAGAVLGTLILVMTSQLLRAWLPPAFASFVTSPFDARVLIFSAAIATASAVVTAALPAWRASQVSVREILQRGSGPGRSGRLPGGGTLLAVEVALSTVLVFGAVMMGRTLHNLTSVDVGFEPDQLLTVAAPLPTADSLRLQQEYGEVLAVLRELPGVRNAADAWHYQSTYVPVFARGQPTLSLHRRVGRDARNARYRRADLYSRRGQGEGSRGNVES